MSNQSKPTHEPVMLHRIVELLAPVLQEPGSVLVDCTLGLGGHALALLQAAPHARLIGIDRDEFALKVAEDRLADYSNRVRVYHAVFDELPYLLQDAGVDEVNAVLMDLGLSSMQIDEPGRGFSYMHDDPLDMRMDTGGGRSATEIVNIVSEAELAKLLRELGDEKYAVRIARSIVAARNIEPITTTGQLVDVIDAAIPKGIESRGHSAKRTFQALRIAVNRELEALENTLPVALDALAPGGRLAVLSYHSGEDRRVKRAFAEVTEDQAPRGLPVVPKELQATHIALTRGAELPTEAEIELNPRAASARLRAVERVA
ncbi:MAG: 16S rRNA (cytosine(1402)-N(4))-methyltransferase RsmH [Propionibacteriaceae bacterium]|jgi:16S rRNA (cytosine1402-N4)-methyltransferase|nr:16S rRNA (cytosine(1402)-N(4))-methyltransferase RsmH [Propionibacteriaceae bacterium]